MFVINVERGYLVLKLLRIWIMGFDIQKYSDMLNMKALVGIRIIFMGKGLQ